MWKKVVKYVKQNGIVQVGQAVSARVGRNDVSGNAKTVSLLYAVFHFSNALNRKEHYLLIFILIKILFLI